MVEVAIPNDSNIRTKKKTKTREYREMPKAERGAGKDVGSNGISGTSIDMSTISRISLKN